MKPETLVLPCTGGRHEAVAGTRVGALFVHRSLHRMYRHELSRDDHVTLLGFLRGLAGHVVLSGYPAALYDETLADWRRIERRAMADGARARTEVLWLNPRCAAAMPQAPLFAEHAA